VAPSESVLDSLNHGSNPPPVSSEFRNNLDTGPQVGGGSRTRQEPGRSPFDGLKDTDQSTRTPFVTRLKEEAIVNHDEVVGCTTKTFNAGWGLR